MQKKPQRSKQKQHTKKTYLYIAALLFGGVGLLAFSSPTFLEYAKNQLAAVMGIEAREMYDYQKHNGITRNLKVGDSGTNVVLVQRALEALRTDFPEANITGYYGEKTRRAVLAYQKDEGLPATGKVDATTRQNLNSVYMKELCPPGNASQYENEMLVKVNRTSGLPKDYVPVNLIHISDYVRTTQLVCLKAEAAAQLKKMMGDAARENVHLAVTSGFRRSEIQGVIMSLWRLIEGERARESVAEPLHSEHQLGTAVDLSGATNKYRSADPSFGNTLEARWLEKSAYKYGFVMSYPIGKTSVTGYSYEPWHYRFVGFEAAKEIYDEKISVEEYFNSHDWLNEKPQQATMPEKPKSKKEG